MITKSLLWGRTLKVREEVRRQSCKDSNVPGKDKEGEGDRERLERKGGSAVF